MVIYVSRKNLIRIRTEAKKAANLVSGRLIIDGKNVYFDDIPIKGRFLDDDTIIIGLPKFIMVGVRTDIELMKKFETDWKWHWYMRLRAGITYLPNFVKVFQLKTEVPPVAENVTISGTTTVGQVLTGSYDYVETDGTAEGTSTFRWLRADTINGTYAAISGATSATYTLAEADTDKFIKFEVTPVAASGTTTGKAVQSESTAKIKAT